MNEEPRESAFDALARGLASGTLSRGKALRLMGAALVGGALASIPGVALAVVPPCPSGTSICGPGRFCCEEGFCCKGSGGKPQCCFAEAPKCCSARGATVCCGPDDICCLTPEGLTCTDTVTTCEQFLGGQVIS